MRKIDGIDLTAPDLSTVIFKPEAEISNHIFDDQVLQKTVFDGVIFKDVVFQNSDIRGASFKDAKLENVTFDKVKLGIRPSLLSRMQAVCTFLSILAGIISAYSVDFLINLVIFDPVIGLPAFISILALGALVPTIIIMQNQGLRVWFAGILLILILMLFSVPVFGNNSEEQVFAGFNAVMSLACYITSVVGILTQAQAIYLAHELRKFSIGNPEKIHNKNTNEISFIHLNIIALLSGFLILFLQTRSIRPSIPFSIFISILLILSGHRVGYLARAEKMKLIDNRYQKTLQQISNLSTDNKEAKSVFYQPPGDKYIALRFIVDAFLRNHQTSFRGITISEKLYLDAYETDFNKADFYPSKIIVSHQENSDEKDNLESSGLDSDKMLEIVLDAITKANTGNTSVAGDNIMIVINGSQFTGGINPKGKSFSIGNFEDVLVKRIKN